MRVVDFYFDYSSTNSYFAAFMLPQICARYGTRIRWFPLHLAALFRETGFDVTAMTPRKARYLWRDHARYAEFTGLPFRKPSRFPIKTAQALRATLAIPMLSNRGTTLNDTSLLQHEKAIERFAQGVFRAYWEHDEDIARPEAIARVARENGLDGERLLELTDSTSAREALASVTQRATERGVFGAPTFFVDDEMFWGKDRLDFVERLLAQHGTAGSD
jgi:2-hydroxychromene-2-carboxylate isomerase